MARLLSEEAPAPDVPHWPHQGANVECIEEPQQRIVVEARNSLPGGAAQQLRRRLHHMSGVQERPGNLQRHDGRRRAGVKVVDPQYVVEALARLLVPSVVAQEEERILHWAAVRRLRVDIASVD
ncbi:hypothetical protein N9L68_08520 [bacterium]|nr:hypothetical protein [bacterium]